jgi:hypothetical protein
MGTMKDITNPRMSQIGIRTRVTNLPNTPPYLKGYKCSKGEIMTFALPKNDSCHCSYSSHPSQEDN